MINVPVRLRAKYDRYIAQAEHAGQRAAEARSEPIRTSWMNIANSYRALAKELTLGRR